MYTFKHLPLRRLNIHLHKYLSYVRIKPRVKGELGNEATLYLLQSFEQTRNSYADSVGKLKIYYAVNIIIMVELRHDHYDV